MDSNRNRTAPTDTGSTQTTMERYFKRIPKVPSHVHDDSRRPKLKGIADETLAAIESGSYTLNGTKYDLKHCTERSRYSTEYNAPDSFLAQWRTNAPSPPSPSSSGPSISILEISTLDAASILTHQLSISGHGGKIGILNFASAKNPGGGFLRGAQAQEESIARASNLYPTLMTATAQSFYTLHNKTPKHGYYSHATIYSPGLVICRSDDGKWIAPVRADVLTSAAVNAGVVRKHYEQGEELEEHIAVVMKERMGRILFLFERHDIRHIVLGSFGTGVFQNDVPTVARLWAELLSAPDARFRHSFDSVIFGILGRKTFDDFERTYTPYLTPPSP